MPISPSGMCAYEGCTRGATTIACGRGALDDDDPTTYHPNPASYCELHAERVAKEADPEYVEDCPNCGCRFGVN